MLGDYGFITHVASTHNSLFMLWLSAPAATDMVVMVLVLLLMCVCVTASLLNEWVRRWSSSFIKTLNLRIQQHSQGWRKNLKPFWSYNHQKTSWLLCLFIPIPFLVFYHLLFNYFMEQQSLPTCVNHTSDGLPVLAAQLAHLLQFTDVQLEAVPTASCRCHLVGLLVCPALAGRCVKQTASSPPPPPPRPTTPCNQHSKFLYTT